MDALLLILFIPLLLAFAAILMLSGRDRAVLSGSYKKFKTAEGEREYLVSDPAAAVKKTRMVIGLHGFTDSARRFAYYTALHNCAGNDTVVVYPNAAAPAGRGVKRGWNAGYCCGSGWVSDVDDAGFIISLTEALIKEYGMESPSVYLAGFSNGAMFAQRLAAEHPDRFVGFVSVAGTIGTKKISYEPKGPVAALLIHGRKDRFVPFEGGAGQDPNFSWKDFSATLDVWLSANAVRDGTAGSGKIGDALISDYQCRAEPVRTIVYPNGRHSWPGWRIWQLTRTRPEASREAFRFLNGL